MIRDFVHLIQNKLRHYAVFPSLHSLSRSSAFQTALFLLGVLAFARACIFLAPPSVTALASASVNGTFMPICRVETDQKKVALTFNCTYRRSHWKISHSELIALPILKRRCFVLKMETMTTLLSDSSRNPAVIRCSGTSIPWTGKTTGHRTSSIGF